MNDHVILLEMARQRQAVLAEDYRRNRPGTSRCDRPAGRAIARWWVGHRTQPA
jgi:hypothetical protein